MITVFAHGLVQRSSLPIPEWLFGWAAAIVLCISFVALAALWPKPRLEHPSWRPLPGGSRACSAAARVEIVGGVLGVAILALVLVTGYAGPPTPLDNFAPTFVFIIFWVGLVFASVLLGDLFRLFNPWRAIGRVLFRDRAPPALPGAARPLARRRPACSCSPGSSSPRAGASTPRRSPPRWPATASLTLAAMAVYGVEPWARWGETFSVYFNLFSRMSVFETRDRVVGVRPFLGGLPRLDPVAGTVALVVVMIGTVTFDGLSQGQLWRDLAVELNDGLSTLGVPIETTPKIVATIGLLIGVALVGGFYTLGIEGARSVGGDHDAEELRRRFIHTLVPIAMVYVAAHYLTFLLFEGQSIFYLASDPLGEGWNLFGTASSAIDYGLLSQNAAWYLQVGFVVLGHVAALVLAHDRALVLYPNPRLAVRSQYWMLAIMVGFTSLALWLLAQAGA